MPLNLTAVGRAENPEREGAPKEGGPRERRCNGGKETERREEGKEGRNGMNVSDNDGAEEEVASLFCCFSSFLVEVEQRSRVVSIPSIFESNCLPFPESEWI